MSIRYPVCLIAAMAITGSASLAQEPEFDRGAEEFRNSCASCHGEDGKGAGFLTRLFKGVNPGDLTQLAVRNDGDFPFLEVFQIVDGRSVVAAHGERKMPVWGDRYTVQNADTYGPYGSEPMVRARILELVYYLQSLQE